MVLVNSSWFWNKQTCIMLSIMSGEEAHRRSHDCVARATFDVLPVGPRELPSVRDKL